MEQTTLIFWGVVIFILLLLLWLLRKYLGRLILLLFFLLMLWGILYFIKPDLALRMWHGIVDLPKAFEKVEKSDNIDGMPSIVVENSELSDPSSASSINQEEQKYSWFASFFGFGTKEETLASEQQWQEETSQISGSLSQQAFDADVLSWKNSDLFVEGVESSLSWASSQFQGTWILSASQVTDSEKLVVDEVVAPLEENVKIKEELVLDPTEYTVSVNENGMIVVKAREESDISVLPETKKDELTLPQKENPVHTSSQKGLSAQDLREANQIFNL